MAEDVSGTLKRTQVLLVLVIAGLALFASKTPVSAQSVEEGSLKRNGYRFHFSKRIMGKVMFGYQALH